jgi:hypothetical protein
LRTNRKKNGKEERMIHSGMLSRNSPSFDASNSPPRWKKSHDLVLAGRRNPTPHLKALGKLVD